MIWMSVRSIKYVTIYFLFFMCSLKRNHCIEFCHYNHEFVWWSKEFFNLGACQHFVKIQVTIGPFQASPSTKSSLSGWGQALHLFSMILCSYVGPCDISARPSQPNLEKVEKAHSSFLNCSFRAVGRFFDRPERGTLATRHVHAWYRWLIAAHGWCGRSGVADWGMSIPHIFLLGIDWKCSSGLPGQDLFELDTVARRPSSPKEITFPTVV